MSEQKQRDKMRESRVRRLAAQTRKEWGGYRLEKSRARPRFDNQGQYMLVENNRNMIMLGGRFDATLDEVEEFLREKGGA